MKTIRIVLPALGAAAGVLTGVLFARRKKDMENARYHLPQGFTVTAHAGSMGTEDNSPESLDVGIANADIIEVDLMFDASGAPVLSHNSPPPENAVRLPELFERLANSKKTKANIDLKSTDNLPEIRRLAGEWGVLDQIFFTGVMESFVPAVRQADSGIPYYLNLYPNPLRSSDPAYLQQLVKKVQEAGAVGINFPLDAASPALTKAFHDAGLLVSVWTAKTPLQAHRALKCAPDNLTTRIPDQVNAMVAASKKR